MNKEYLVKYPWMRYLERKKRVHFVRCYLFGPPNDKEKMFGVSPVSDWKNLVALVNRHLRDGSPHYGNMMAADSFIARQEGREKSIKSHISSYHEELVQKNRQIIIEIMKVIALCRKQNIPLRGNTPESNFLAILHFKAEDTPVLREHLANHDQRASSLSPTIQNEIIAILGQQIRDAIVDKCNKAGCFALIADEATDKATTEQVSICVRFVSDGILREEFLGFVKATSTTGEALAETFLNALREFNVNEVQMVGQGYDGASNMRGYRSGVQRRIRNLIPSAVYVHCHAHCLNLSTSPSSTHPKNHSSGT